MSTLVYPAQFTSLVLLSGLYVNFFQLDYLG